MDNQSPSNQPIHSEEMHDIISSPPAWLLRWGILIFFLVLVMIISLSAIIKYPEIEKAQLTMRANYPLTPVIANFQSRLLKLLVHENQRVVRNQPLAHIHIFSRGKEGDTIHVLRAPDAGEVLFPGILQEGQYLKPEHEILFINPLRVGFYGEMAIPQAKIGKIKMGQTVFIKLKSFPFEEFGMLKGKISFISNLPGKGGAFMSRVTIDPVNLKGAADPIKLTPGMLADAEVIVQDATLFSRITRKLFTMLK